MATKNLGKKFEEVVKTSFEKVHNVSVDRLRDAPKKLKNVDNPADFIVYKKPHEIYVECKSHRGNSLPFSCIRTEQIRGLIDKSQIEGVKAGIMLWFIDHDITIWIDIDELCTLIRTGYKSINVKDLDHIDCIYILGKKKRVYFEYDMKQFLLDLFGEEKYKGLCVTCSRRRKCPKANRYEDVTECKAYKVHTNRKEKPNE